jgi:hypothetical protein
MYAYICRDHAAHHVCRSKVSVYGGVYAPHVARGGEASAARGARKHPSRSPLESPPPAPRGKSLPRSSERISPIAHPLIHSILSRKWKRAARTAWPRSSSPPKIRGRCARDRARAPSKWTAPPTPSVGERKNENSEKSACSPDFGSGKSWPCF